MKEFGKFSNNNTALLQIFLIWAKCKRFFVLVHPTPNIMHLNRACTIADVSHIHTLLVSIGVKSVRGWGLGKKRDLYKDDIVLVQIRHCIVQRQHCSVQRRYCIVKRRHWLYKDDILLYNDDIILVQRQH